MKPVAGADSFTEGQAFERKPLKASSPASPATPARVSCGTNDERQDGQHNIGTPSKRRRN